MPPMHFYPSDRKKILKGHPAQKSNDPIQNHHHHRQKHAWLTRKGCQGSDS